MDVVERRAGDRAKLSALIDAESNAKQRDRYRAAALALDQRETEAIVDAVGRSRRFVQRWAYAYRDGGIEAIKVKKPRGADFTLPRELHEKFAARIEAGPLPADGVCTLRRREVVQLLEREFGVCYSLSGVYDLLHRLGFSSLRPRPKHRKNDPAAMDAFQKSAPFVQGVRAAHPDKKVEVWFQDEARVGQQGTLTRVWARRNTRPRVVKQTEYQWVYLYGAVNPQTGQSAGMIGPTTDTEMMSLFLYWMGKAIAPDAHAVLVLDGAGWHKSKALRVPDNITLLFLPPYSPELNPTELVWLWLKEHHLSNRVFADQHELDRAVLDAWNTIDADRFKSLCSAPWITRENQV